MKPEDLVTLAEQIVQLGAGSPRQAGLNRAVSTAYYALLHALSRQCVAALRIPKSARYWDTMSPVYRAIDHGAARKLFERLTQDRMSSVQLKQIGRAFLALQVARIAADYDPNPISRCSRKQALDFIAQARRAIEVLGALSSEERTLLSVQLITKQR